jgi:hypothetical protein
MGAGGWTVVCVRISRSHCAFSTAEPWLELQRLRETPGVSVAAVTTEGAELVTTDATGPCADLDIGKSTFREFMQCIQDASSDLHPWFAWTPELCASQMLTLPQTLSTLQCWDAFAKSLFERLGTEEEDHNFTASEAVSWLDEVKRVLQHAASLSDAALRVRISSWCD